MSKINFALKLNNNELAESSINEIDDSNLSIQEQTQFLKLKADYLYATGELGKAKIQAERAYDKTMSSIENGEQSSSTIIPFCLSKVAILNKLKLNSQANETLNKNLTLLGIHIEGCKLDGVTTYNRKVVINLLTNLIETKKSLYVETNSAIHLDDALCLARITINLLRDQRQDNSDNSYLSHWAKQNQQFYDLSISIAESVGDIEMVFEIMEENKSNLLHNDLTKVIALKQSLINEETINIDDSLRQELKTINYQISKTLSDKNKNTSINELSTKLTQCQSQIDKLNNKIKSEYPEYYNLLNNRKSTSISEVQSNLDKETALVEFFVSKNAYYIICLTSNSEKVVKIKGTEDLNKYTHRILSLINEKTSLADLKKESTELYNLLFKKLFNSSHKIKNLIIVPDGQLNNFPFEILRNDKGWLLNNYSLQYQFSTKIWRILHTKKAKVDYTFDLSGYSYQNELSSLGIGKIRNCHGEINSSLICSDKEKLLINGHLSKRKVVWSKGYLETMQYANQSKILHLATHSCLNLNNIDSSRLYFGSEFYTLEDIRKINFDNELTVLSSCESGLGKVIKGEGSLSIAKTFFQSGSKSALVSLWPVDDCSTSDIMAAFYSHLSQGKTKDLALREAKLDYLENAHPTRLHPYYWAGFVIIGNDKAVWNINLATNKYLQAATIIIILIFLLLLLKINSNK